MSTKPEQSDRPRIVAVTACTAGVAHTYMAAEALKKAAAAAGADIKVETQGTTGVENRVSPEEAAAANAAIFAHDVAIKDVDRFASIPTVDVSAAAAIKDAAGLVSQALGKMRDTSSDAAEKADAAAQEEGKADKPNFGALVKDSVLTGISYIIPVIIAGGMISALATIIGNAFGLQALLSDKTSWLYLFKSLGSGALGTLMVPLLSAYMAYALADKPGLGPGFIAGLAANMISSGFLGGMLGGLLAGFIMRWMKENIKATGPCPHVHHLLGVARRGLRRRRRAHAVRRRPSRRRPQHRPRRLPERHVRRQRGPARRHHRCHDLVRPRRSRQQGVLRVLRGRHGQRQLRPVLHLRLRQDGLRVLLHGRLLPGQGPLHR
ncbi:MAG: fructose PTS transporter subunit IIB [Atopobiaceae bacterium]|jgi:fructose-specific phosphotransferase system IIB component|nr:fructose PTS transporter subunit IIB [Atopobiaceae bacterium]